MALSVPKAMISKKINSLLIRATGMVLLLIFIAAMKYPSERSYTYLALGDSYTVGEQVAPGDNFPNQVYQLLGRKGVVVKDPKIVAETGWTTDELQDAINKEKLRSKYDFVTLLIGVNNQYRGRNIDDYSREFESLLKQAITFAGNKASHVIVLSIPDWGITPFAEGRNRDQIAREIDLFNQANNEISARYDVNYIDITPNTRKAAEDLSLLATDGLHPSGKEYAIWAEMVAAVISRNIN
jgi:lysophospholipase L1-like esterase